MKTVYLGTSGYAAAILRRLNDSPHRPTLVVSRPDSPQGRGRKLTPPPAVTTACELGLQVFQPEAVNDEQARTRIAAEEPEVLIVCAYGGLIREPLLSEYRILNVHPSLLPRWRGAAPIERAILAGDSQTGVSIMVLTAGLDSGPVCLQEPLPIDPGEDWGAVTSKLEELGGDLLVQALDEEAAGADPARCTPQDDALATYAEKVTAEDRRLDPSQAAVNLELRVRALNPHIGTFLELKDGTRLGIGRAEATRLPQGSPEAPEQEGRARHDEGIHAEGTDARAPHAEGPQAEGTDAEGTDAEGTDAEGTDAEGTLLTDGPWPLLVCREGLLKLLAVQPPGKRMMDAGDYLRGLRR